MRATLSTSRRTLETRTSSNARGFALKHSHTIKLHNNPTNWWRGLVYELHTETGVLYHPSEPSWVEYHPTIHAKPPNKPGPRSVMWTDHKGYPHRDNDPAELEYSLKGRVVKVSWSIHGICTGTMPITTLPLS